MPPANSRGPFSQWGASWDWDWEADSSPAHPPAATSPAKYDSDDDGDLAWRMQLEDLRMFDEAFLEADGGEDEDEEFAISQQVAEIEAAERAEREGADVAFLMALEEVGAWWAGEVEEGKRGGGGREGGGFSSRNGVRVSASRVRSTAAAPELGGKASSAYEGRVGEGGGQKGRRRGSPPPPPRSPVSEKEAAAKRRPATTSARSSSRATQPLAKDPTPICAVCHESPSPAVSPVSALATLPCKHVYCSPCLDELFRTATADVSLFPPRCCGVTVPLDASSPLPQQPNKGKGPPGGRVEEVQEPSGEGYRKYLSASTVAAFERRCAKLETDAEVKGEEEGDEENKDGATKEFLEMAEACGWARCCTCRRFVELEFGCNHMTYVPFPSIPCHLHPFPVFLLPITSSSSS